MRAVSIPHYGPPDCVQIVDLPRPAPKKGQMLIHVEAAAVSSGDARIRSGRFPRGFTIPGRLVLGVRGPRRPVLGGAFAGRVVECGDGVEDAAPGDRVAGLNGVRMGAHAELLAAPSSSTAPIPREVRSEDAAAAMFGGSTALYLLRQKANLGAGERILVNGASGSVGSAAVQLAKHLGADVTAVTSAGNAALVTRLGADRVIDYTATPLSGVSERFDVVLDAVGNLTRADAARLCADDGRLVLAVADLADTILARGRVIAGTVRERPEDFRYVLDLVAKGAFDPLTTVVGGLDSAAEAYRRVDSGRKVGNLVIVP
ncbi:NAD(P)-dependent alcohol dehydrogenase [Gordonia iterans]